MRRAKRWRAAIIGVATGFLPATEAYSVDITVTLTIQDECVINSADNLAFDPTGVIDTALTQTGDITVQCTTDTAYQVGISAGAGTGATVATRYMTGPGGALVSYSIYQDSGHTTVWGNTPTTDTVDGTGDGDAHVITMYALVPVQVTPAAGNYTDTVAVTVTY